MGRALAGPAGGAPARPCPALRASDQSPPLPLGVSESPCAAASALSILSPAFGTQQQPQRVTTPKEGRKNPHGHPPERHPAPTAPQRHRPAEKHCACARLPVGRGSWRREGQAASPPLLRKLPSPAHAHRARRREAACPFPPPRLPSGTHGGERGGSGPAASERRRRWGVRRAAGSRVCAVGVSRSRPGGRRRPSLRAGGVSAASTAVAFGGLW